MIVFVVIALLAALLNTWLIDLIGSAIVYGIAGVLCGLVLRTRLEGGVARMLVVCFFGIGFAAGGVWSMLMAMAFGSLVDSASMDTLSWAFIGFAATTPYLGTRFAPAPIAMACFGAAAGLAAVLSDMVFDGLGVGVLFFHPLLVCLAAGVFDQICGSIGLESPEKEFARLRVRLEFRWR
jgi:hypothetical protein